MALLRISQVKDQVSSCLVSYLEALRERAERSAYMQNSDFVVGALRSLISEWM
jgi:hypothetical protein